MLFPSAGQALPSHYNGSRTNHSLRLSVSTNLTLFTCDLSLSFSQTAPLPYMPTVRLNHFLLSHVLYLPCSPVNLPLIFSPLSYLSH